MRYPAIHNEWRRQNQCAQRGKSEITMSHGQTDERDDADWEIAQVTRDAAQAPGDRANDSPGAAASPLAPLIEARLDLGRAARKGIPEVVLAESKRDDQ